MRQTILHSALLISRYDSSETEKKSPKEKMLHNLDYRMTEKMEFLLFVLVSNLFTSTTTALVGLLFVYAPWNLLAPSWRFFISEGTKYGHTGGQRPTA